MDKNTRCLQMTRAVLRFEDNVSSGYIGLWAILLIIVSVHDGCRWSSGCLPETGESGFGWRCHQACLQGGGSSRQSSVFIPVENCFSRAVRKEWCEEWLKTYCAPLFAIVLKSFSGLGGGACSCSRCWLDWWYEYQWWSSGQSDMEGRKLVQAPKSNTSHWISTLWQWLDCTWHTCLSCSFLSFHAPPLYLNNITWQIKVIHPPLPTRPELDKFRSELVYLHSSVISLKTAENWMRSKGRIIQKGSQPFKVVKVQAGMVNKMQKLEVLREVGAWVGEGGIGGKATLRLYARSHRNVLTWPHCQYEYQYFVLERSSSDSFLCRTWFQRTTLATLISMFPQCSLREPSISLVSHFLSRSKKTYESLTLWQSKASQNLLVNLALILQK